MYFPPTGNPTTCAATTDCPGGQSCVNSLCMLKVPYDGAMGNGWAYTDANDTAVQAYGSWCDMIKASGANTVQVIYGCPTDRRSRRADAVCNAPAADRFLTSADSDAVAGSTAPAVCRARVRKERRGRVRPVARRGVSARAWHAGCTTGLANKEPR